MRILLTNDDGIKAIGLRALSEAAQAFALYKNPRDVHGKIMLINEEA